MGAAAASAARALRMMVYFMAAVVKVTGFDTSITDFEASVLGCMELAEEL